jgi:Protein of unknown function (DUF1353)
MRVEFPTTCDVRFHHKEDGVRWELLAPFVTIVDGHLPTQRIIRTPAGFLTDFASVPRLPLVYLAYGNKVHLPAIPHDDLYRRGGTETDRQFADDVFLAGMLAALVNVPNPLLTPAEAHQMYLGVRLGGGAHFNFTA